MSRRILLRLALPALAVPGLLANSTIAQSRDSQSVAEAARRAREQKKATAKPVKVITDDDVKPAEPGSSGATPAPPAAPISSNATDAQAPAETSGPAGPKNEKKSKEIAALKEMLKQIQSDLDLLQREQALEQDTYYSNPDYVHDTAGKSILDAIKQQIGDKQQELDQLKAKLAELGANLDKPAATPPKP
jgi:DNA repair exonuclease SbcCD ATPase subunit